MPQKLSTLSASLIAATLIVGALGPGMVPWNGVALAAGAAATGSPVLDFEEAEKTTQASQWDLAASRWDRYVHDYPTNRRVIRAWLYLAQAEAHRARFASAAEEAERVLATAPADFPDREAALLQAGEARLEQGRASGDAAQLQKAIAHLKTVSDSGKSAHSARAGLRIIEAIDLLNKPAEAAAEAGSWLTRHAEKPVGTTQPRVTSGVGAKPEEVAIARYLLGRNLVLAGDAANGVAALTEFLTAGAKGPRATDALFVRGQGFAQLKKYDDAAADFIKAQAGHPRPDLVRFHLGLALQNAGKTSQAADAFVSVAEVVGSPLAADALYRAGRIRADLKDYPGAAAALQAAIDRKLEPSLDEAARYRLAYARFESADDGGAITVCEDILFLHPGGLLQAQTIELLACAHTRKGHWQAARASWSALADLKTDRRPDALASAADAAWAAGLPKQAANDYQAVLAETPRSAAAARAALGMGRIHFAAKRYADAERALRQGIGVGTAGTGTAIEAETAYWLGECLASQNKLEDAAVHFDQAAGAYSAYAEWAARCLFRAGTLYDQVSQDDATDKSAQRCFQTLLKKYPSHSLAGRARARLEAKP